MSVSVSKYTCVFQCRFDCDFDNQNSSTRAMYAFHFDVTVGEWSGHVRKSQVVVNNSFSPGCAHVFSRAGHTGALRP